MNLSQAVSNISHLKLIESKFSVLAAELEVALKNRAEIDQESEELKIKLNENAEEFQQKRSDMERSFAEKLEEYGKQVRYFEEMLHKKIEERDSQLGYLRQLNINERIPEDLIGFNWDTLKRIASNGDKNDARDKQYQKAIETSVMAESAQIKLERLGHLLESTIDARRTVSNRVQQIRAHIKDWRELTTQQQKTIGLHESENYRLMLIVKQCISNDEPVSENITRNVRDKCHSFINSENDEELAQGLRKYHKRQANKIRLLRRQVNKLSNELSLLQVASDQTSDVIQHYLTMIHTSNSRLLSYNPSR